MKEIRKRFEVWAESDGDCMVECQNVENLKASGQLESGAKLVHVIEAANLEEARAIWNLRRGYEPYSPAGESKECPRGCGAHFYPEGSGQCPYCGDIC